MVSLAELQDRLKQQFARLDQNGDGIPDAWWREHGMDPATDPGVDTDNDGVPTRDEYLEAYFRAGGVAEADQLETFVVLSLFRNAAILAGIRRRFLNGNAAGPDAESVGARYAQVAELALQVASGSAGWSR